MKHLKVFLCRDYIIIAGPGLCQAFSDYQMQQMTSNFIEQFGFNDEEFADQDDVVEWVLILHEPLPLTRGPDGAGSGMGLREGDGAARLVLG